MSVPDLKPERKLCEIYLRIGFLIFIQKYKVIISAAQDHLDLQNKGMTCI